MKTAFQINAHMKMDRLRFFFMKLAGLNTWTLYELSQNFEDSEMVFCFKNCLDILWGKIVLKVASQERYSF